jgi:hypothetical protein
MTIFLLCLQTPSCQHRAGFDVFNGNDPRRAAAAALIRA